MTDFEYMLKIQELFVSEKGYIIDTGNYQNVNEELLRLLESKKKRHPLLWKLFVMVA